MVPRLTRLHSAPASGQGPGRWLFAAVPLLCLLVGGAAFHSICGSRPISASTEDFASPTIALSHPRRVFGPGFIALSHPRDVVAPAKPGRDRVLTGAAMLAPTSDRVPYTLASPDLVKARLARLPLSFEPNQGQFDPHLQYLSRGPGYTVAVGGSRMVLALHRPLPLDAAPSPRLNSHSRPAGQPIGSRCYRAIHSTAMGSALHLTRPAGSPHPPDRVELSLVDANLHPRVQPGDRLPGVNSYFTGRDPRQWKTGLPTYASLLCRSVYPGIDLRYYGSGSKMEHDFIVAPGANPGRIRIGVQGCRQARMDSSGGIRLRCSAGTVALERPRLYQVIRGVRHEVSGHYQLLPAAGHDSSSAYGFTVGRYDHAYPLIIDPVLSFSSYLGGSGSDYALGIAADSSGSVYVTGATSSTDFPARGSLYPATGATEIFVSKLNPSGTALVYSTYIEGGGQDVGQGIAVDSSGSAYVTGYTTSTKFPTVAAAQPSSGGGPADAFALKLSPSGTALAYSTYLGGSGDDEGSGIAVSGSGSACVTGFTTSGNFPEASAAQGASGGGQDAFVTRLAANGGLVYSTYLGGSGDDQGYAVATDASGDAYVAGATGSNNFPAVRALQPTNAGSAAGTDDAFVAKLNSTGAIAYSSYLGGTADDGAYGIAIDAAGDAFVTGSTSSSNFPTASALQPQLGGGQSDAFVTEINSSGSGYVYSTYLGGSGNDTGNGIAVDSSGSAVVTGITTSNNFPTVSPVQAAFGGGPADAFVTKLSPSGSALVYSTYLGGTGEDSGNAITIGPSGAVYVAGSTLSTNFPVASPLQSMLGGGEDAFVACLAPSTWRPVDVAAGSDGKARLLWTNTGGIMTVWSVDNNGNPAAGPVNGPYPGFKALAAAAGSDGLTRVLWRATNNLAALWLMNASNGFQTYFTFGPYTNWAPQDVTVGSDNRARILWTNTSGAIIVWSVDNNGNPSAGPIYGPYAGFNAVGLAAGSDGTTWILWSNPNGTAVLWLMNPDNTYRSSFIYGPYAGWSPTDLAVGSDNQARVLWVSTAGQAALWTVNGASGSANSALYGPYAGYTPLRIAAGSDGLTRLLWRRSDNAAALWLLTPTNQYQSSYAWGPY